MIDIEAAYVRGLAALTDRRTDSEPHIGTHLAGMCDRESWAKRRFALAGDVDLDPITDPTVLTGFWLGHSVEAGLLDRIEAGLPAGFAMARNVDCDLDGLTGHIDAVIHASGNPALVIDTKSTVWWPQTERGKQVWKPKEVKHNQELQVAAYALAIGAPAAGLYELDLGGKARRWVPVDPEEHRAEIEARAARVIDLTDPTKPEPQVGPNWDATWMCGSAKTDRDGNVVIRKAYCGFTACPRHVDNALVTL
jgi:hypothetical protein